MTEIDYDVLAPKLATIIHADVKAGLLPELQGPIGQIGPIGPIGPHPEAPPASPSTDAVGGIASLVSPATIDFALSALGVGGGASLPIWAAWMIARTLMGRTGKPSGTQTPGASVHATQPQATTSHDPPAQDPPAVAPGFANAPYAAPQPPAPQHVLVNDRVSTEPRYVRTTQTDQLGEAYKEAIARETEMQGDRFRAIADRMHSTAKQIAHGAQVKKKLTVGWSD
jgi:hypothetical protein